MRLNSVTFINNKIFNEKTICFTKDKTDSKDNYTTIIIGPNGTGKSTLLREIARIFRDTFEKQNGPYEKRTLEYKYLFNYYLNDNFYDVSYENQRKAYTINYKYSILGKWKFPSSVIAISSMSNDKFVHSKNDDNSIYKYAGIRSSRNNYGTKTIIKNLINLLANSSFSRVNSLEIVLEELGFKKEFNIYFESKNKGLGQKFKNIKQFDNYFKNWNEHSSRQTIPYSFSIYDKIKDDYDKINKILDFINNNLIDDAVNYDLFCRKDFQQFQEDYEILQLLLKLDLIKAPIMFFNKDDIYNDDTDISSGEYNLIFQFIRIFLLVSDNCLLLIDEPEISLHPNWQLNYLSLLEKCLAKYKGIHTIIATHSHLLLSSLNSENSAVITISKDKEFDFIDYDIYGWSPENILYRVFNITSYRNKYFEMDLRKLVKFIETRDGNISEIKTILSEFKKFKLTNDDPLNIIIRKAEEVIEK